MFSIIQYPQEDQAYAFLLSYLRTHLVTIFADCEIRYEGRAYSTAKKSPRLIIIKQDGSIIVHEHEKREPINWQPPGTEIYVSKDPLMIKGVRKNPKETLIIYLNNVYYITSALVKEGEFNLKGDEIDLVNAVIKNPSLIEDGLKIVQREYRTPLGIVDLLAKDKNGIAVMIEFKRRRASLQAVSQLQRYVMFGNIQFGKCRGILVAPGITQNARKLLEQLNLEFKELDFKKIQLIQAVS